MIKIKRYKKVLNRLFEVCVMALLFMIIGAGFLYIGIEIGKGYRSDLPLMIAERFSESHEYDYDLYDCKNYSGELNQIYEMLGYESYYYSNRDIRHAYVLVPLEPQNGKLFKTNSEVYGINLNSSSYNNNGD